MCTLSQVNHWYSYIVIHITWDVTWFLLNDFLITGVLKLYLRLLPIPLISYDAYPHLIDAISKFIDLEFVW